MIWVVSSDFQQSLSQYETGSKVPPRTVCWCGTDGVVMELNGQVTVIGPFGNTIDFSYRNDNRNSRAILCTEVDGVRVVSQDVCDFIQKIPRFFVFFV